MTTVGQRLGERIRLARTQRDLSIESAAMAAGMDPGLNEVGYIVPGLGDAGDRLYGVV